MTEELPPHDRRFAELTDALPEWMQTHAVPGLAVGILREGQRARWYAGIDDIERLGWRAVRDR